MGKTLFIVFIFFWNLAAGQNQYAFFIDKSNSSVVKFKLPAEVILSLTGKYKMVGNQKEFSRFDVVLVKVCHDSLFIQSLDKKSKRVLLWDSVEHIIFLKQNTIAAVIVPYMIVAGVMTLGLPFLFKPIAPGAFIYSFCLLFTPITIIKWSYSKRGFEAENYLMIN